MFNEVRHCAIVMEDFAVIGFFYIFSTGEKELSHMGENSSSSYL